MWTTKFAARNNGGAARQESNPQSATAYSSVRYGQVKKTRQSIISTKNYKIMSKISRTGKDGVEVTFPSTGYIYREGKDGRIIAFPSTGCIYREGKDGRVVAFQSTGYIYREGKDGRVIAFPSTGYKYSENSKGRIVPEKI